MFRLFRYDLDLNLTHCSPTDSVIFFSKIFKFFSCIKSLKSAAKKVCKDTLARRVQSSFFGLHRLDCLIDLTCFLVSGPSYCIFVLILHFIQISIKSLYRFSGLIRSWPFNDYCSGKTTGRL